MASVFLDYDQVAAINSINASGSDDADVDIDALFPVGSAIEIVFDDADFDGSGNLDTSNDVFIDIIITESNNNVITINNIKLDLAPEKIGDTYISTADAVTFTDSNNVDYDSQIIAVTQGTLTVGNGIIVPGNLNSDSDTVFNICFEGSTLIETKTGPKLARDLAVGEGIRTLSGATRNICWILREVVDLSKAEERHRPILFSADSIGVSKPTNPLILSSQHRILVGKSGQLIGRTLPVGLVAAKALTSLPKVRYMRGKKSIEWVNFAFGRHDVVKANGLWVESLYMGKETLKYLQRRGFTDYSSAFDRPRGVGESLNGPLAYPELRPGKVRRALSRELMMH